MLPILFALAVDSTLARQVHQRIDQVPGAVVAVYYRRLSDGDSLAIDADTVYHAASTMKVPVMITLFRAIDAGRLQLDQPVLVTNQFTSLADGSPFSADSADDSDSTLYHEIGQRVPLSRLMDLMIQKSSNLATNTVIELVGATRVDSTAHALGVTRMRVLRGVEDGKAFKLGLNNVTTARDLGILMRAIAEDRAASRKSCEAMRHILLGQEFDTEIPAGLPPGTRVAHKTGWITGVLHDGAIVYPNGGTPYVLVVLTRGIPDVKVAQSLIADISRLVYARALVDHVAADHRQ
ncbi:MAG TPA: serine hydrolase [Gemmatimonadaceae bacterium]|nr:serine hydrolase [Gemmatimonadaceae bacterium]